MKPILLTLNGGLGNQLFQLCAGIRLSQQNWQVVYNAPTLKSTYNLIFSDRRKIEIEQLVFSRISAFRYPLHYKLIYSMIKNKNPHKLLVDTDSFTISINNISEDTVQLVGFFQDWKIVDSAWPSLVQRMRLSSKFSILTKTQKINRIAVHVRLGDYKNDANAKLSFGLTTPSYYLNSINFFLSDFMEAPEIVIISDDIEAAKEFLPLSATLSNVHYISNSNAILDLSELVKSSHIVMSNSTFSWWGAWMAYNFHQSKVIYPRPWFANKSDPEMPIFFPFWRYMYRDFYTS